MAYVYLDVPVWFYLDSVCSKQIPGTIFDVHGNRCEMGGLTVTANVPAPRYEFEMLNKADADDGRPALFLHFKVRGATLYCVRTRHIIVFCRVLKLWLCSCKSKRGHLAEVYGELWSSSASATLKRANT